MTREQSPAPARLSWFRRSARVVNARPRLAGAHFLAVLPPGLAVAAGVCGGHVAVARHGRAFGADGGALVHLAAHPVHMGARGGGRGAGRRGDGGGRLDRRLRDRGGAGEAQQRDGCGERKGGGES